MIQVISAPLVAGYTLGLGGVGGVSGWVGSGEVTHLPRHKFLGGVVLILLFFLSSSIYSIISILIYAFLNVSAGCKGDIVYGMRHRVRTGRSTSASWDGDGASWSSI